MSGSPYEWIPEQPAGFGHENMIAVLASATGLLTSRGWCEVHDGVEWRRVETDTMREWVRIEDLLVLLSAEEVR